MSRPLRRIARLGLAAFVSWAAATPAAAQLIVHDPTNYASLVRQAATALKQLDQLKAQLAEAQRLYDGFNTASGAGDLAAVLATPELRAFVPAATTYAAAARGDLTALGEIGRRAAAIRSAERLFTAPAQDPLGQDVERQGDRAARDLALGEAAADAGARRLAGLQVLAEALDGAANARAVMDLQARLAAEQAMSLNDQMRLQGLAMAQAAEARLQTQRDQERAAAARQARMQRYQTGF
jgi:type IV secretion system protein VirB5